DVKFCTQGFTKNEVEYLAEQISSTIGIETKIEPNTTKNPEKGQYSIKIYGEKNVPTFFSYLDQAKSIVEAKLFVPHKFETKWSPITPEMKKDGIIHLPDLVEKGDKSHLAIVKQMRPELIDQTRSLLNEGLKPARIARMFGVNRATIYSWIKKYSLKE
ncbi:MAG: terminase gpP N-terminus-related DNA-binding protein, partial [Candidatus Kariarchaeaceae archaeon]